MGTPSIGFLSHLRHVVVAQLQPGWPDAGWTHSSVSIAHPVPVVQVKALWLLTHLSPGKGGVIQDSSSVLESFAKPHKQVV